LNVPQLKQNRAAAVKDLRKNLEKELADVEKQLEIEVSSKPATPRPVMASLDYIQERGNSVVEETKKLDAKMKAIYNNLDSLIFEPNRKLGAQKQNEIPLSKEFVATLSTTTKALLAAEKMHQALRDLNLIDN
jgi:hypothetical protein